MGEEFAFTRVTREKLKARLGIFGPSGSGKTYTGLLFANELADHPDKVFVIDTEHGKAATYQDIWPDFQHLLLEAPYHPQRYQRAMKAAVDGGAEVVLIDSITHEWEMEGGVKEIVDQAKGKFGGNTHSAWSIGTPLHNRFVESILALPCHVIATMRAKTDWLIEDRDGKKVPKKVGLAPVQRDSIEYEFDLAALMDVDHNLVVTKSHCRPLPPGTTVNKPNESFIAVYRTWLEEGAEPTVRVPVTQSAPAVPTEAAPQAVESAPPVTDPAGADDPEREGVTELLKQLQEEFPDHPILQGMSWEERMALRSLEWFGKTVDQLSPEDLLVMSERLQATIDKLRDQQTAAATATS